MIYRVTFLAAAPKVTWVNMPAAETEFLGDIGGYRQRIDVRWAQRFRLFANVRDAGAAGARLRLKYWTGSAFVDLSNVAGFADNSINSVGEDFGALTPISGNVSNSDDSLIVAIFGVGGDGVIDPSFTNIAAEFFPL